MASKRVVTWDDIADSLNSISSSMERVIKACKGITAAFQELIDYAKEEKWKQKIQ